jgi:predicted MPP superfamily phosphohydrolase
VKAALNLGPVLTGLIIVILVVATQIPINTSQVQSQQSKIPAYGNFATPIPTKNIGPGAPLTLQPGDCQFVELVEDLDVKGGYISRIVYDDLRQEINLVSYNVSIEKTSSGLLKTCAPRDAKSGLYDFTLITSDGREVIIPRSFWVVSSNLSKLRIVFMTDLHFGAGPGTVYDGDVNRISAFLLANALNPDFIIWGGDIEDIDSEVDMRNTQVFRYMLLYNYPVLSVGGNHDYPGNNYRKFIGPTRWVRLIGDKLVIIGVYTVPYENTGNIITWDEIKFLEEALSNYSYIPFKIIVTHYPMFYYQGELTTRYDDEEVLKPYQPPNITNTPVSSYWSVNMTAFRYVLKLIEDYNVTIVFSGHIHQDQFVKYTSTRTNTTTYFITMTTTAHGTSMYQGILVVDLKLDTCEFDFPFKPPTFIGFKNSTAKIAYNSIPVSLYKSKVVKTPYSYYIEVSNSADWLPSYYTALLALPWSGDLKPTFVVNTTSGASIIVKSHRVLGDKLYLYINMSLPAANKISLLIQGLIDEKPPILKITYTTTPILNRTFTLYIDISDDVSGLDISGINIGFNGTQLSYSFTPSSLTADLDKITVSLKLTMKAPVQAVTLVTAMVRDNSGKVTTKKYVVVFYPPGATPAEKPVYEVVEETTTPPTTPSTTPTTTIPTTTTPTTQTTITTPITPTTQTSPTTYPSTYTTSTPTSTSESQTTTTPTTMPTTQIGGVSILTISSVIVIVIVLISTVVLLKMRKK